MATVRPRTRVVPPQPQPPAPPQFGGAPAPAAGTPQSANWMQPRQSSMTKMQAFGMAPMPPDAPFAVDEPVIPNTAIRPQNVMTYGPNVVPQRGISYQPPSPNSSVFLPRGPMSSSASLQSQQGFQTDQYGRQYQMTPQMAGTAMPTGGAGAWMQGRSLSGAPAGVYVQSNLPAPAGGMERVAAGMAGQRPSAFAGMAGGVTGRATYEAMRARRQQQADQRIVARARIRGLGQNTPAVRMAMQRLGMLNPSGAAPVAGGQPAAVPGVAPTVPGQVSARNVQRWSGDPFVVGSLGTDYASSTPDNFRRAFGMVKTPADHQKIAEAWRDRVAMEPELGKKVAENPALKEEFDAFTGGVDSWGAYSKIAEERRRKQSQDPAQPLPPPRPPVIPPLYNDRGPRSSPYYIPPTSPGSR